MVDENLPRSSAPDVEAITVFDLASQRSPECKGFSGAIFDGRYVYYVPLNNGQFYGQVARCDTQASFADASSWAVFDTTEVHSGSKGFVNGIFDGRYLYLVPYNNGECFGQVTRYDTSKAFASAASWEVFDTVRVDPHSKGFIGAVFDGRHVYLVPYQLDYGNHHGQVTRYDTQREFSATSSWEIFDMAGLDQECKGFHSGCFDGRYVYFCPYLTTPDPPAFASKVVRYDPQSDFCSGRSWQVYDLTQVHADCKGFIGAIFDGHYLYFVPYNNGRSRYGQVARYSVDGDFTDAQSWDVYDSTQVHPNSRGFFGALFDGRFIYFIPHCRAPSIYNGQMTRYDTHADFGSASSWSVCDTASVHPDNKGFIGGAFDGKYLYLTPFETIEGKHSGQTVRIGIHASAIWE